MSISQSGQVCLDVAGPARAGSDDAEIVKGGTGFGARTLLRWLEAGARVDGPETVLEA
jgi:leucyl aminopeptidase